MAALWPAFLAFGAGRALPVLTLTLQSNRRSRPIPDLVPKAPAPIALAAAETGASRLRRADRCVIEPHPCLSAVSPQVTAYM
ncbi:MAG: hypothetical protein GEV03_28765 [Streptosporangiales bacterium]|nr:hypothetical protein [Streptosporangiales bacterium]